VLLTLGILIFFVEKKKPNLFSFCFKQDGPIIAPLLLNGLDTDVIDLTPFLSFKSKQ
jgi:hypothetical protein